MRTLRKTKLTGWFEFMRQNCPICNHHGGCMIHEDGDRVACIRVESETIFSKNSALPSYLHYLNGDKRKPKIQYDGPSYQSEKKAADAELNKVYRTLLHALPLEEGHYQHLTSDSRQLTDEQIAVRGYKSFPEKPWNVVKEIGDSLYMEDFTGVPGFYEQQTERGSYFTLNGRKGILIPFRNHKNEIVGCQYRIDQPPNEVKVDAYQQGLSAKVIQQPNKVEVSYEGKIIGEYELTLGQGKVMSINGKVSLGMITLVKGMRYYWLSSANKNKGTGAGEPTPVHISVPSERLKTWHTGTPLQTKRIWVTEGPTKGDISSDLLGTLYTPEELNELGDTFLSVPGANSWRIMLPTLKEMGVEHVNLALDGDAARNPYVKKHLFECAKELKALQLTCSIVLWNVDEAKGIDDCLLLKKRPIVKRLF
ncbi:hypothetical protein [Priestia koreensis]|uniref:DUF3854 domain-containing protein n=1 Tax=Priestia koreensis TaxID=284581 RepID=A0A0M0LBD7_9BACI|nr:hypothetical protein [Priestia koreensis]KOO48172.1 hypothetical protein AMD01_05035 [Priestia koreensis]